MTLALRVRVSLSGPGRLSHGASDNLNFKLNLPVPVALTHNDSPGLPLSVTVPVSEDHASLSLALQPEPEWLPVTPAVQSRSGGTVTRTPSPSQAASLSEWQLECHWWS